jgi:hypothetical protein
MEASVDKKSRYINLAIALCLILVAIILRFLPHPANFAPVAAIAIFGGAILPRRLALFVPVAIMVLSDMVLGFYNIMPVIWGCYLFIALASFTWLRKPNIKRGLAVTLSGSVLFFVVTNFAVWLWTGMYAHTIAGLIQCYWLAIPFFRNTLLSDLIYTGALFGLYQLATSAVAKKLLAPSRD